MNQLQFYKYATWALLIINTAVLSFFLLTKPHPPKGGPGSGPRGGRAHGLETEAVAILQLDAKQKDIFLELAKDHGKQLSALGKQERDQLRKYFDYLIQAPDSTNKMGILEQIKVLEGQKVSVTYDHFKSVQELLREDQQENFERFMRKALNLLLVEERR